MKCQQCDRPASCKGLCKTHYERVLNGRKARPTQGLSEHERFMFYVEKTDTCWLWKGSKQRVYGMIWSNGKNVLAHRYSYLAHVGEIPDGMFVCHRCDNPLCVNPDHLFVGEAADNTRDMMNKGRGFWPHGDDHHLSKITDADVIEIASLKGKVSQKAIAKKYGIDPSHVSRIMSGHKRGRAITSTPSTAAGHD